MNVNFPTDYEAILQKMDMVDPIRYGKTRNYINGAVSYLSPYISRGVISTQQVFKHMLSKGFKIQQMEYFVKELSWRDYFQRVGQHKDLNQDIRKKQEPVTNNAIPVKVVKASTGIYGIDYAINQLYATGYMHNHCRMYTASLVCNIANSHWKSPSQWMYYHLFDGDWASNTCSWQWVAGSNSNKKYYANQDNINKYVLTNQSDTFLDQSYDELEHMETPDSLKTTQSFVPETVLPVAPIPKIDVALPTYIYNYYNLDPKWHAGEAGNRILLIEPEFFSKYPVHKKCMDFMLELSKNIPGIQPYVGSFQSLIDRWKLTDIYFKEHPLNTGYKGTEESRDWIAERVNGYYTSFFAYWKKVQKHLIKSN